MIPENVGNIFKRPKHKTYRPLDDNWVILSMSKAFDYFSARRDKMTVCKGLQAHVRTRPHGK